MRSLRVFVVCSIVVIALPLFAQSIDPALTAAIAARDKASMSRDVAGLARYTADDYVAVNPNGALNNKQQRLDGLKTPPAPGAKPPVPQRIEAVHMYGTGGAVVRTKGNGNRNLSVWIRDPKGWQMHVIHVVPDTFLAAGTAPELLKAPAPSAVTAPAGLSGDGAAVFTAFKQIQDAVWSGDIATYEKLSAPEFVRLLPGIVRFGTREAQAANGGPRKPPTHSDYAVSVWDQLGVVRWRERNSTGVETWLTRVFARKPAGWQQVATASSLAAKR